MRERVYVEEKSMHALKKSPAARGKRRAKTKTMSASRPSNAYGNGSNGREICARVIDHIIDCSTERLRTLTLAHLMEAFRISKMYLCRCFKTYRNITPGKFIFHEKMQRASAMILKNHILIKEVADKLGFSSADYFTQAFKRHFGKTPSQYRQLRSKQDQQE